MFFQMMMIVPYHATARATFDAPLTSPLPDVTQVVVGKTRVSSHAPMYSRRFLAFETILVRTENGGRGVPHVIDQNDIR